MSSDYLYIISFCWHFSEVLDWRGWEEAKSVSVDRWNMVTLLSACSCSSWGVRQCEIAGRSIVKLSLEFVFIEARQAGVLDPLWKKIKSPFILLVCMRLNLSLNLCFCRCLHFKMIGAEWSHCCSLSPQSQTSFAASVCSLHLGAVKIKIKEIDFNVNICLVLFLWGSSVFCLNMKDYFNTSGLANVRLATGEYTAHPS